MIRLTVSIPLLVLVAGLAVAPAQAQHDTRGRSFWVTFMSSWGEGYERETPDLRLYLSAEKPTVARIIPYNGADTLVVGIPVARTAVEVDISARLGPGIELGTFEERSRKGLQIVADDEITCYGVTIRENSADAFLALPDDVLTRAYIVLAYPNGYLAQRGYRGYDMPSQFAVVATEDGTTVTIEPTAKLYGRPAGTFSVTLDRGEVFNGQAEISRPQDVSGTRIRSTKPVAVFGGVRRASVPVTTGNYRDFLVEQMPPLETWGKEAIVTPHFPILPQATGTAAVRVLAAFDDTRWQIDGIEQPPLARAASVEFDLTRSRLVTADKPILVAQYEHSASGTGGRMLTGDPFMMIIPPTEQFDTSYVFQSVSHPGFRSDAHFINIVAPTAATGSVRLDGRVITPTWQPTPKPGYSFTQVNVLPGSHAVTADSAFGIYSYGFGAAISYGYAGGMLFRRLVHDFEPPDLEASLGCAGIDGAAIDADITDLGIDSLYAMPDSRNVTITIDPFDPGADTVRYRARLVDPYEDGWAHVKAIDSAGRSRTLGQYIPGLTVRIGAGGALPRLDTLRLVGASDTCITLELENHGLFAQTVSALTLDPPIPGSTITTSLPVTIAPGARVSLQLCARGWTDTVIDATVVISNGCVDRDIALLPVLSGIDTTAPRISSIGTSCARTVVLTLTERSFVNSGIRAVFFDELLNGEIIRQSPLPASDVEIELAPIDPWHDLVYQLRVTDGAGNVAVRRDTIGGFTLTALDDVRDSVSARFDRELRLASITPGGERCDSIVLRNYGARALRLSSMRFRGTRGYSVPPSQFPCAITPFSDLAIAVCLEAGATGLVRDTLDLIDDCGREDAVILAAAVPVLMTVDACNNALRVRSGGAARRTFLATPFPNPTRGTVVTVDVGLAADAVVELELVDAAGHPVEAIMRGVAMRAGLHRIDFDVASLGTGAYFCRLRTSDGALQVERFVVNR